VFDFNAALDVGGRTPRGVPPRTHDAVSDVGNHGLRRAIGWGVVFGAFNLAAPIAFWWLDRATAYALVLPLIAAVYIGFAVADGRVRVIIVEACVASVVLVLAAAGVTGSAWILVVGYSGHGLKDLWQHRTHFVANTRWWPPFCATIDFIVAAGLLVEIAVGLPFR
jgi:hypothetical protein